MRRCVRCAVRARDRYSKYGGSPLLPPRKDRPESYTRPTCSYEWEWAKRLVLLFAENALDLTDDDDERQVRFLRLLASWPHIQFWAIVVGVCYLVSPRPPACTRAPLPPPLWHA